MGASCTAYSTEEELLVGNMTIGSSTDKMSYVCAAFKEINSRIGYIYELPLNFEALAVQSQLVLNKINNFIASGRLIMAMAIGAEQQETHAYGQSLVREGYYELGLILDGSLPLVGAEPQDDTSGSRHPETVNRDLLSPFEQFEDHFFNVDPFDPGIQSPEGGEAIWIPGGTE